MNVNKVCLKTTSQQSGLRLKSLPTNQVVQEKPRRVRNNLSLQSTHLQASNEICFKKFEMEIFIIPLKKNVVKIYK